MSDVHGAERRRRTRVRVNGEVSGRIHTVQSAPVIDISETGALLEVPCSLRPGSVYVLRLPLGEEVVIRTRVVRSYVHGMIRLGNGESALRYRAALEFVELGDKERQLILQQVAEGESVEAEMRRESRS